MQDQQEWIINVHGTFAAKKEHTGDAWWQFGSAFCESLTGHLPDNISVLPAELTFHWSGENSERAREQAARDLLDFLDTLDRPFHIVAHSHGGSLVWRTLKLSQARSIAFLNDGFNKKADPVEAPEEKGLRLLKSWTTIGTPYIKIEPEGAPEDLYSLFFTKLFTLLFFVIATPASIIFLVYAFFCVLPGPAIPFNLGLLAVIDLLSLAGPDSGSLVQAGLTAYTMLEIGLLLGAALVVLFSPIGFFMGARNTAGFFESQQGEMEKPLELWASRVYGPRFLPLWSQQDEAIQGIQTAYAISKPIIPRIKESDAILDTESSPVFYTEWLTRLASWPLDWFWVPLYNNVIAPVSDRLFWNIVRNASSGNDKPGTLVSSIGPGPSEYLADPPALPSWMEKELVDRANEALAKSVPRLRPVLMGFLGRGQAVIETSEDELLSGGELVHTSYYLNQHVIRLVAGHIVPVPGSSDPERGAELTVWQSQLDAWRHERLEALKEIEADPGQWSQLEWTLRALDAMLDKLTLPVVGGQLVQMIVRILIRSGISKKYDKS